MAMVVIILSGCSSEDGLNISVFANEGQDSLIETIQTTLASEQSIEIEQLPPHYERLITEIAAHNGDVLVVQQELINDTVLDPEGLVPLDIDGGEQLVMVTNPETGEEEAYGLILPQSTTTELIALIPVYSRYQDQAVALLQQLVD